MVGTLLPVIAGVLMGGMLIGPFAIAAQQSAEARNCGATDDNKVQAEFDVQAAKEIWTRFPAMLQAPELEVDDRPAHVVVFAGDYDARGMMTGNPLAVDPSNALAHQREVVCVVQSDGTVNVYTDVSRRGSEFAG